MSRSPTLAEAIRGAIDSALKSLHVAMPAHVVKYDPVHKTAEVQLAVQDSYVDENGKRVNLKFPTIPRVPVSFSSGGGMSIVFPLVPGDSGLVVFSDVSLDHWKDLDNATVRSIINDGIDTTIDHEHHLIDAVFIPGIHSVQNALKSTPADNTIQIGKDNGSFQGVVLGDALESYLGSTPGALGAWLDGLASAAGYVIVPRPSPSGLKSATVKVTP